MHRWLAIVRRAREALCDRSQSSALLNRSRCLAFQVLMLLCLVFLLEPVLFMMCMASLFELYELFLGGMDSQMHLIIGRMVS